MRKFILGFAVLCIIGLTTAWFGRSHLIRFAQKHPAIHSVLRKGAGLYRSATFHFSSLGNLNSNESMSSASLKIDFTREIGTNGKFWQGLGQDSFNDGFLDRVNRNYYELIGEMNHERPVFRFAHSKGMLCDTWHQKRGEATCGQAYRRDGSYYWDITNSVFDMLMANGMTPLVSFTYMPSALASDPRNVNPWNKSNVSPPNDYRKWQEVIYNTVQHLKTRYGSEEISDWYFEVWNEPDLPHFFWVDHPQQQYKGDNREYFKLYDYTVAGAVKAESGINIGGPAIAGDIDFFINDWLPHCRSGRNFATGQKGSRVDFLSVHCYGPVEDKILPKIKMFIDNAERNGGDLARNADFLITEYGPIAQPSPWLNNRYVAAWLVKLIDGIFYLGDEDGQQYIPDQMYFWSKPVPPNFNDHFGIVTALGNQRHPSPDAIVKRPVFNAFDALARLGDTRLKVEGTNFGDPIHAIAAKDGTNSIQVLLYHLLELDYQNSTERKFPVSLNLTRLPFEQFKVETYVIDDAHSNGFTRWNQMDSPQYPSPDQLRELQENDDLQLVDSQVEAVNASRSFRKDFILKNNSVILMTLTKIK